MNSDLSTQWKTRQRTRKQSLVSDKEWVPGCVVKKAKHETEHIWSKLKRVGKYREKLFNICKKEKKKGSLQQREGSRKEGNNENMVSLQIFCFTGLIKES